jgi:hypothetical protein
MSDTPSGDEVKRYDVHVAGGCASRGCNPYPDPFETVDGIWVDYTDHMRVVRAQEQEIQRLREALDLTRRPQQTYRDRWMIAVRAVRRNHVRAKRAEQEIAALRVSGAGPDLTPWQPIETAPKDGTWFLAWDPDGGCYQYRDGPGLIGGGEPEPTHWMPLPAPPSALRVVAVRTHEQEQKNDSRGDGQPDAQVALPQRATE